MSAQSSATITGKSTMKKVLINSTVAAIVATSGTTFISQYFQKPATPKVHNRQTDSRSVYSFNFITKSALTYTMPEPYAKAFIVSPNNTEEVIKVLGNNEFLNESFEPTPFPVKYVGKLPVPNESSFVNNNEREIIDISQKVEKISIPVRYGGRLPVGRERI